MSFSLLDRTLSPIQSIPKQHGNIASYVIVETAARLYLAQKLPSRNAGTSDGDADSNPQLYSTRAIAKRFQTLWSRRPFQYSGAINL